MSIGRVGSPFLLIPMGRVGSYFLLFLFSSHALQKKDWCRAPKIFCKTYLVSEAKVFGKVHKTFGKDYQMEFVAETKIFGANVWLILPNAFVSFDKIHNG